MLDSLGGTERTNGEVIDGSERLGGSRLSTLENGPAGPPALLHE